MEKRIENLEILSMDHESTVETLSREVHRQQIQIRALEVQLKYLRDKIETVSKEEALSPELHDEPPPPHY